MSELASSIDSICKHLESFSTLDFFNYFRWVDLTAVKRLVDTDALQLEKLSESKVSY